MAQTKTRKKIKRIQDKTDWEELCSYINVNVMGRDKDMALPKNFVKKLENMSEICDNFEPNKDKDDNKNRNYYYHVILNTYKYCSPDIQWALKNKDFNDSTNKFNYIAKIVENKLDVIYVKMKDKNEQKEKRAIIDMSVHHYKGADFKPTQRRIVSSRLKELWNEVL